MKKNSKIFVTKEDAKRLETVVAVNGHVETAPWLESEISRAELVEPQKIPPSVITMNSRIKYKDQETGKTQEVILVYPQDADFASRKVSVLAPVGVALLGLSEGQSIECQIPGGKTKRLQVVKVTYQPEAAEKTDQKEKQTCTAKTQ